MSGCPLCRPECVAPYTFYRGHGWFAFLSNPPHVLGHTIMAAESRTGCPQALDALNLTSNIQQALRDTLRLLNTRYHPKDYLIASLRGSIKHYHWHILPLWELQEEEWRQTTGYRDGHLMEYMGYLERRGDERNAKLMEAMGWSMDDLRGLWSTTLQSQAYDLEFPAWPQSKETCNG